MSIKFAFKNIAEETRIIKRRVYFSAIIILMLITLVLSRLFYLQVIQQDHYVTLSKNNRVKVLPIPPIRGLIYSRDGVLLAENQPSFSLEIVPEQIDDLDGVIKELKRFVAIQDEDQ